MSPNLKDAVEKFWRSTNPLCFLTAILHQVILLGMWPIIVSTWWFWCTWKFVLVSGVIKVAKTKNWKRQNVQISTCFICRCEHARSWCDILSIGQRAQKPGDSICSPAKVQRLYRCGDTFCNFTLNGNYLATYSNPIIIWDSLLGSQKDKTDLPTVLHALSPLPWGQTFDYRGVEAGHSSYKLEKQLPSIPPKKK